MVPEYSRDDHVRGGGWMSRRQRPEFHIVPIQRLDVYQSVLERIRALITDARMQPGDQLPGERELSERLGVSRVSVRQAIKVLVSMGLLDARVGSGTFVRNPNDQVVTDHLLANQTLNEDFLNEIVAVRTALELQVFSAASERWTTADSERMSAFLSRAAMEIGEPEEEPGSLDLRFEAMVAEVAGNRLLQRFQSIVHQVWVRAWSGAGLMPDRKDRLHQEHVKIYEAMAAGDWDQTLALLEAHVNRKVECP